MCLKLCLSRLDACDDISEGQLLSVTIGYSRTSRSCSSTLRGAALDEEEEKEKMIARATVEEIAKVTLIARATV